MIVTPIVDGERQVALNWAQAPTAGDLMLVGTAGTPTVFEVVVETVRWYRNANGDQAADLLCTRRVK